MKPNKLVTFLLVAVGLLILPLLLQNGGNAWVRIVDMALLYVLLALGLNIVVGYAGLLDLGYVAFFAVGAYLAALLGSPHLAEAFPFIAANFPNGLHLPIWAIIPVAAGIAGLFGVILDVDLEIVDNDIYQTERQVVSYQDFPEIFEKEILPDPNLGLFYGHLSTARASLLDEMIFYKYTKVDIGDAEIPPLGEVSAIKLRRFVFNFSKLGAIPMSIKWYMEKNIEPMIESCTVVPRTQAMAEGEACFVSRNDPMHDSVPYIRNNLKSETDILHEYFIPRDQFILFVDGLRKVVQEQDVNLLNASVRVIHPEHNFLNYAPGEMYSIVLYINQPTTPEGNENMGIVTRELIDLTAKVNGRFFLPYQLHYTAEQLQRAYPEIGDFFAAKKVYDPTGLFTNTFYEKYAKLIANQ